MKSKKQILIGVCLSAMLCLIPLGSAFADHHGGGHGNGGNNGNGGNDPHGGYANVDNPDDNNAAHWNDVDGGEAPVVVEPEVEVCPEDPQQPVQCQAYVRQYQSAGKRNMYLCVDRYQPVNGWGGNGGDADGDCVYRLAQHDCKFIKRFAGCFDPSTEITMADQSIKSVMEVQEGDLVWNPLTKSAMKVAKRVAGPEAAAMLEIGFAGKTVRVTEDHPMMVLKNTTSVALSSSSADAGKNYSVKRADQLTKQDKLIDANGQYQQITVLRKLPVDENQVVINFEVETTSSDSSSRAVLANGIVTGDLKVQSSLKKEGSI